MNIKRAKQEIKDTIQAYLLRDDTGAYAIPSIRQRPVLLIGPRAWAKPRLWNRYPRKWRLAWWLTPSPTTRGRARWGCRLLRKSSTEAGSTR